MGSLDLLFQKGEDYGGRVRLARAWAESACSSAFPTIPAPGNFEAAIVLSRWRSVITGVSEDLCDEHALRQRLRIVVEIASRMVLFMARHASTLDVGKKVALDCVTRARALVT